MKFQALMSILIPYNSRGAEMVSFLTSPQNYRNVSNENCENDAADCASFDCSKNPITCIESPPNHQNIDYSAYDFGVEQKVEGLQYKQITQFIKDWRKYMVDEVMTESKYATIRYDCKNRHELCSFWAMIGECENNPGYMKTNCAPSCRTCDQLDFDIRCPFDPNLKNSFETGDVNKFFERIVNDEEFAKYNIAVHSRPKKPDDDDLFVDGPWLITFDDFISPEEANRLIELGGEEGYKRSTDVGELNIDGSYTDYESFSRTSNNAWCFEDSCMQDPIAKRVVNRIEHVTRIPQTNSENLQLLRYEEGQYYGVHHDLIEHQKNRPPGVRILTFYMYLNGNEESGLEGGGTKFPRLNVTVTPKLGRAAMWSSVYDHDPHMKDPRTEHTALPVIKGVKYGANAWIHQRDYLTPNKSGCT